MESRKNFKFILWLSLGVANAAVIGLSAMFLSQARDFAIERASEVSRTYLHSFKGAIEMRLERVKAAETLLAEEIEARLSSGSDDPALYDRIIAKLDAPDGESFKLKFTDEFGNVLHGEGASPQVNYLDRGFFKEARARLEAGESRPWTMSGALLGKASKRYIIVLAMPYRKPGGAFGGVIAASMTLHSLREVGMPESEADNAIFTLRDSRDMKLLASRNHGEKNEAEAAPIQSPLSLGIEVLVRGGKKSGTVSGTGTFDGKSRTLSYDVSESAPILMVVGVSHSGALAAWRAQAMAAAAGCLAFLLFSLLMGRAVLRYDQRAMRAEKAQADLNASLDAQVKERTSELEEAMRAMRKTRDELDTSERMASLGAMVAGVAHELNTPIGNALLCASSIEAASKSLLETLSSGAGMKKSELIGKLSALAELARVQADTMSKAATLVSSFKQVAVDQASSRRRVFELKQVMQSVVDAFGPSIARCKTRVSVSVEGDDGVVCDTYPGPLSQIAGNMIQNALKHGFDGRESGVFKIGISVHEREASELWARVEFTDDGKGLDKGALDSLFEDYFTTKADEGGSGLGLSLSRRMARAALSGSLEVGKSSRLGEGATFLLEFPLRSPV